MTVFVDSNRVYSIREDIIRPRLSGLNDDCEEEEEGSNHDDLSEDLSYSFSSVSKRMFEMFFTEKEEGPDRDWSKYLYMDIILEEDRPESDILQGNDSTL